MGDGMSHAWRGDYFPKEVPVVGGCHPISPDLKRQERVIKDLEEVAEAIEEENKKSALEEKLEKPAVNLLPPEALRSFTILEVSGEENESLVYYYIELLREGKTELWTRSLFTAARKAFAKDTGKDIGAFILSIGDVLGFGAKKHGKFSWKKYPKEAYIAAVGRHILKYIDGEKLDPETGFSHLSHIGASLMFLEEFQHMKLDTKD